MPQLPNWIFILAIWVVAASIALAVAAWTEIGPVVLVLSRWHGVHLGDLVVAAGTCAAAAVLTDRRQRGLRSAAVRE